MSLHLSEHGGEHPAVAEAREATRMPLWFWPVAPVVFCATVLLSAMWPSGWW